MTASATPDQPPESAEPLPWWHPGVLVATGFGLGYLRPAPGTWGSLLGLPLAYGLLHLPIGIAVVLWIACLPIGWWATRCGMRHFVSHDPGGVVVDEYLAIPLAAAPLFGIDASTQSMLIGLAAAFGCFRLFDIWKPGPVGWCDRLPGASGVMLDDLAAGVLAAGLLAVGCLAA